MSELPGERPRILVVDDEKVIREMLAEFLGMEGYEVHTAEDGVQAVSELERRRFDLVVSDLKMPRMGGIALLDEVAKASPDALTVIMTGFGTVETAIDAMKRGAFDYVLKPFKLDEVVHVLKRGLEKQRLSRENLRLREALSLYKVSEAIASSLSLEEVLATVADSCVHELAADLSWTYLDDGEGGTYERQRLEGPGLPAGAEPGQLDQRAVSEALAERGLVLESDDGLARYFRVSPSPRPRSVMGVPLRTSARTVGFLFAASFAPGKRFDEGQRKLLSMIASRAAAAIENARLYEDLQATFQQTIEGLAKAIDKMDPYTAGHSDRVATYAVFLATQLGLSKAEIEIVRHSALMHDIGKIGCVLSLNKPGKLTPEEFDRFKAHPGYGRDILEPIKFLRPLIPGVHLHHERWDGRGYPLGLVGETIPIVARIISVADTYDAMTSDRSYRRALPHQVAVAEIKRCSGTQFDPGVAHDFHSHIDGFRAEQALAGKKTPS